MNDPQEETAPGTTPEPEGLTQWQRVGNTFSAPSRTFQEIARGKRSWWLPFVLMMLFSYALFASISYRIGWEQVARNAIQMNPRSEARLEQASPQQAAGILKATRYSIQYSFLASPVIVLLVVSILSLGLLGTLNFGFGGKATFGEVFAVWMYAALPTAIKSLLGIVVIFAGLAPESFNIGNFAPTSVGAFLNPLETNHALYALATRLDFTSIWSMVLLSIGAATVARLKPGSGYMAVFGWWTLFLLISAGWAAAMG